MSYLAMLKNPYLIIFLKSLILKILNTILANMTIHSWFIAIDYFQYCCCPQINMADRRLFNNNTNDEVSEI